MRSSRGVEQTFAQSRPSTRRVFSICCFAVAGFLLSCTCLMAFVGSPGNLAKGLVLSFQLLPALIFLSIGQVLSPERRWTREVGIVLIASAASGALLALTVKLMFMDPKFQESVPPEKLAFFSDYVTGILWIMLMAAVGGVLLFMASKRAPSRREKPPVPPIISR